MGIIYKTPITDEQQRGLTQAQEQKAALDDIKQQISDEQNARSERDNALERRVSFLQDSLNAETAARTAFQADLSAEQTARADADNNLQIMIGAEILARQDADEQLRNDLSATRSNFTAAINSEQAARTQAINDMRVAILASMGDDKALEAIENEKLRQQIEEQAAAQASTLGSLSARLNAEEQARAAKDTELQGSISTEIQNRKSAVSTLQTSLTSTISGETSARQAADSTLQANIDAEAQTRANEDSKLQGAISKEIQDRKDAVSSLQTSLTSTVSSESTARANAVSQLQTNLNDAINNEITNRNAAIETSAQSVKSYVDSQIAGVEANLNDFTIPTATAAGKRGLVPYCPAGTDLKFLTNYGWYSGGDSTITISAVPAQAATLTFNGSAQEPAWLNFDNKKLKIEGELSGVDAKTYTVTFTPLDIYIWEDTSDQTPKSATWKIEPLKLVKPTAGGTTFTYNGSAQGIAVSNFNSTYESQTGTVSATAANSYSATYKLRNTANTKWTDNSTADVVINWKINPLLLAKPTANATEIDFDGTTKTLSVSNFNSTYENQTGTASASAVGDYSVYFSLKNTTNTKWADSTTGTVTINWSIVQRVLTAAQSSGFEQVGTLTYNGSSQTVSIKNYDSDFHILSSTTSATAAGTYTVKISPKSGYKWSDGTNAAKSVSWKINPKSVTKPTAAVTNFDYASGNSINLTVNNYDNAYMTQSGTTSASAVGSYSVTYTLKSTSNYIWADSTTGTVTINWSIGSRALTAAQSSGFQQVGTLTYSGGSQAVTIQNYDSDFHSLSSTTSATAAGTYTAKISPKSGFTWSDGTNSAKDVTWKINPLPVVRPSISGSASFIFDNTAKSVTVNGFDSAVMVEGSNSVKSATIPGNYSVIYTLKSSNYTWSTNPSTAATTLSWEITGRDFLLPTQSHPATFTYNKNAQTFTISPPNSMGSNADEYMTVSGAGLTFTYSAGVFTAAATDAGVYTVNATLKYPNYFRWYDRANDQILSSATVTFTYTIEKAAAPLMPSDISVTQSTFEYTGNKIWIASYAKDDCFGTYAKEYIAALGNVQYSEINNSYNYATDIGDYHTYVRLNPNYTWQNGTSDPVRINWKITRKVVAKPHFNEDRVNNITFVDDGSKPTYYKCTVPYTNETYMINAGTSATIFIRDYDWTNFLASHNFYGNIVTTTYSAKDVGTYHIAIGLKDTNNTCWDDSTTEPLLFVWQITGVALTAAQSNLAQDGTLTYNGLRQTVTLKNFDSSLHTLKGTASAVDAGVYTASVTPAADYTWDTGSSEAKDVAWSILANQLGQPTAVQTDFTYDGDLKSLNILNYNPTYMTQSGTTAATAAGSYSVVYSLRNKTNTCWAGGSVEDVVINWSIGMTTVAAPALNSSTFTYDGNLKTPTFSGVNNSLMTLSSETSAINAGVHTVVVSLANPSIMVWDDNSNSPKSYTWKINRKPLTATQSTFAQSGTLNFNGASQSVTLSNFNANYHVLSGTTQAVNANSYTVKISPLPNFCWQDGTVAPKSVSWTINPLKLTKPTAAVTNFTYDKNIHSLAVQNLNSNYVNQGGTVSAKDANFYSSEFSLKSSTNTVWADNSIDTVIIKWSITKKTFAKPTVSKNVFTYNASTQTLSISGFYSNYMIQTGTSQATAAGDYQLTFSLKDKTVNTWDDSSTADVVIDWKINRKKITSAQSSPYQKSVPTYTGSRINFTDTVYCAGYSSTRQIWSGTTYSTDTGTFTAYVEPAANYTFLDGSTAKKAVKWEIAPAQIAPPAFNDSVALTYDGTTKNVPLNNFDANKMTLSGTSGAVDAGEYSVSVTPQSNYIWTDGTQDSFDVAWKIDRQKLSFNVTGKQSASSGIAFQQSYDGNTYNAADYINNYDPSLMTLTGNVTLKDTSTSNYVFVYTKDNYLFENGRTFIRLLCRILRRPFNKPAFASAFLNYTGSSQSPVLKNALLGETNLESLKTVFAPYGTISGTTSASAKGSYSVTFSFKDKTGKNYVWNTSPATTDDLTLGWSIGVETVTAPTLAQDYFDYDGTAKNITVNNFDSNKMTQTGASSRTAKGFYTVKFSLKDKTGTCWSTGGNEDIVIEWAVGKKRVAKPAFKENSATEFTYDGNAKTITLSGVDANTMTTSGYLSATAAGDYSCKVSLKSTAACQYVWEDNTTSDVTFNWKINKAALPDVVFAQQGTLTYDGTSKTVSIKNYDASKHDITGVTATAAGNHVAKITPKANYTWQNGAVTAKSVSWKINPIVLTKPAADENILEFTGVAQTLDIVNFNSKYMTPSGNTATAAGNYTATVSLKSKINTVWQDGGTDDVVINWSIGAIFVDVPAVTPARQISAGLTKTHSVTVTGFNSEIMQQTGTVSISTGKAASYTVTFSLVDKTNYRWADNSTANKNVTWYVDRKTLTAAESSFVQDKNIPHDSLSHSALDACSSINPDYIGDFYTLSTSSGVDAGTYTTAITPTAAAQWNDTSTSAKSFNWRIDKVPATLSHSVPNNSVTLNDNNLTVKFSVSSNSNGAFSVTSEDTDVAVVSYTSYHSSNPPYVSVTLRAGLCGLSTKITTITINQAEGTNHAAAATSIKVSVLRTLNSFSWAEIDSVTKAGRILDVARIGDSKQISVAGTVGILPIDATFRAVVIGVDHNAGIEGNNRAHFAIFKNSDNTKQIAFVDSDYGKNTTVADKAFVFHNIWKDGKNVGYSSAAIRTRCAEFLAALPADLQAVISACKKYSGSSFVTDKIWIPSAYEVAGRAINSNYSAYCQQYDYWANGNSRICYKHNSTGTAAYYWLRDYDTANALGNPMIINTSGNLTTALFTYDYGFLPCFTIGG